MQNDLFRMADQLRSIANKGLFFRNHPGDVERYKQVQRIAAQLGALADGEMSEAQVLETFENNWMAITPLAGADAAVFRDGKILLIQRSDNQLWAMPGGAVDVGEVAAEAAVRELREETHMQGSVLRLLGVFDSLRWKSKTRAHLYHHVFEVESADLPHKSAEAINVGFFGAEELPPLAAGHVGMVPHIFKMMRGEANIPYVDLP